MHTVDATRLNGTCYDAVRKSTVVAVGRRVRLQVAPALIVTHRLVTGSGRLAVGQGAPVSLCQGVWHCCAFALLAHAFHACTVEIGCLVHTVIWESGARGAHI